MSHFFFKVFYAFLWVLTLLPLRVLYLLSDLIFILLFWGIRYRRKVVWENLSKAFPEKSEKERKRISRRYFRHLCDYFFETIKMIHLSEQQIQKRVGYDDDYFKKKTEEGKNVVGLLGHNANWEWLTSIALQDNFHWIVPYHPLQNSPRFDAFMKKLRSRFGPEPVPMNQTYRRLMEISKSGKLFMAGMIADQSPPNPKNGHWLTFLNQDTAVMKGAERIAQKTDASIVYCKMLKVKRGYYKVVLTPITDNIANEESLYVTERYFELLEEHIKEQPECWLWSHRRWKYKRTKNGEITKH